MGGEILTASRIHEEASSVVAPRRGYTCTCAPWSMLHTAANPAKRQIPLDNDPRKATNPERRWTPEGDELLNARPEDVDPPRVQRLVRRDTCRDDRFATSTTWLVSRSPRTTVAADCCIV